MSLFSAPAAFLLLQSVCYPASMLLDGRHVCFPDVLDSNSKTLYATVQFYESRDANT